MKQPRATGFLILQGTPVRKFLLMKHADRWDLPKGHVDPGESDLQCAFRELQEETGIMRDAIQVHPDFEYFSRYPVDGQRYGRGPGKVEKTTRLFLGTLLRETAIEVTEHEGFEWFAWNPPHQIQTTAIDPLLAAVEKYFAATS